MHVYLYVKLNLHHHIYISSFSYQFTFIFLIYFLFGMYERDEFYIVCIMCNRYMQIFREHTNQHTTTIISVTIIIYIAQSNVYSLSATLVLYLTSLPYIHNSYPVKNILGYAIYEHHKVRGSFIIIVIGIGLK